jgi:predicted aspartyl protease
VKQTKCGFDDQPGVPGVDALEFHGPTLYVDIGFDPAYVIGPASTGTKPQLAATQLWALVDTGAGECCIDTDLAKKLALPVVDRRKIAGAGGLKEVDVYMAHIHVPSLQFTMYGVFAGVDLQAGGQRHFALIGRTFLRHFTMVYEGTTGTVSLERK